MAQPCDATSGCTCVNWDKYSSVRCSWCSRSPGRYIIWFEEAGFWWFIFMLHRTEGEFLGSVSVSIILAASWCSLSQQNCFLTRVPVLYSQLQLCGLNFFFVLSSLHGGTSSDGELCLGKASSNITVPSSKIGYFMHNLILIQVKRHISRSALCSYFFKWQHFSSWQRTKGVSGFPIHCPPVSCLLGSKSSISKFPEKTWMWILFLWKEESLSALMHQPLPVSSFNQY